jgi:hypothetical protein
MYVMGVNLTGVHLIGVYLIGVYLMGVHLIDVYIMVFGDPPSNQGRNRLSCGKRGGPRPRYGRSNGRSMVDLHFGEVR